MNTKQCKDCGWVYGSTDPRRYCEYCGYDFFKPTGKAVKAVVVSVKEPEEGPSKSMRAWRRKVQRADDAYDEWLGKIAAIPKPYSTLTEQQWLEACEHFGGCALCNSESIDTRGFFIRFSEGGMYCDWNVIPMCERCATIRRTQANPFRQMHEAINRNLETRRGMGYRKVNEVARWLRDKLERAAG